MKYRIVFFVLITAFTATGHAQGYLRASGQDIIDGRGNKVMLRGVGLGNWMLPEGYMWKFGKYGDRPRKIEQLVEQLIGPEEAARFWKEWRANYITEADIRWIKELGFNSVRPALNSRLFVTEGEQPEFIDEGFLLLDSLVQWCNKYGVYVIIDMHGAPGGQTGQNIDDSPNNLPELFMYEKNQDLLTELWVRIASRYKNDTIVAAYNLLNEPLPESTGAADRHKHQLIPLYQRLIKAIREVDQNHMFTLEGYNWSNNWSLFDAPLDSNVFYQFHYYCWDKPTNLHGIDHFIKHRETLQTPIWAGETGEKNNAIYFATTQYFEQNNIGWSFWPWKKMETVNTPFSIKAPKNWNYVSEFSRTGIKSTDNVNYVAIFNELLKNIRQENCVYFQDVVNSIMRRTPLRVEAENYGHRGYRTSYFVKTKQNASYYRKNEPVPIKPADEEGTNMFIELNAGEWTNYEFRVENALSLDFDVRVRSVSDNARLMVVLNGNLDEITVGKKWKNYRFTLPVGPTGPAQVKLFVNLGSVQIDYFDVK